MSQSDTNPRNERPPMKGRIAGDSSVQEGNNRRLSLSKSSVTGMSTGVVDPQQARPPSINQHRRNGSITAVRPGPPSKEPSFSGSTVSSTGSRRPSMITRTSSASQTAGSALAGLANLQSDQEYVTCPAHEYALADLSRADDGMTLFAHSENKAPLYLNVPYETVKAACNIGAAGEWKYGITVPRQGDLPASAPERCFLKRLPSGYQASFEAAMANNRGLRLDTPFELVDRRMPFRYVSGRNPWRWWPSAAKSQPGTARGTGN